MRGYLNPANAVTASRFLTLPPFLYCMEHDLRQWALVSVIVCGLLDKLDGAVAVVFECKSEFGALFDAVADAVCYGFMIAVLAWMGAVPLPQVAALFALGAVNVAFRGVYAHRVGRATNYRSFAMERVVAYFAYLCGFGVADYEVVFYYSACVVVMAVVVAHDAKRMFLGPVPA